MQAMVCATCHQNAHQTAMITTDPHAAAGLACASCHSVHNNHAEKLTRDDEENYCLACHSNVAAEFKRRSSHPLEAGFVQCVDCHNLGSITDPPDPYRAGLPLPELSQRGRRTDAVRASGYRSLPDRRRRLPGMSPAPRLGQRPAAQPARQRPVQFVPRCSAGTSHRPTADSARVWSALIVTPTSTVRLTNRLLLDPNLNMKFASDCYQSGCHVVGR